MECIRLKSNTRRVRNEKNHVFGRPESGDRILPKEVSGAISFSFFRQD